MMRPSPVTSNCNSGFTVLAIHTCLPLLLTAAISPFTAPKIDRSLDAVTVLISWLFCFWNNCLPLSSYLAIQNLPVKRPMP